MIIYNGEEIKAYKAAQTIVWLYGAQWSAGELEDLGIDEAALTKSEEQELIEQLKKQERRVQGLFGI
jgi:hypothetical protein